MIYTDLLKKCFKQDFDEWIWHTNDKTIANIKEIIHINTSSETIKRIALDVTLPNRKEEILNQILDVLIREPNADYFWFHYDGELTYTLPADYGLVSSAAMRVDNAKIKSLIRDIKLNQIGI
jgi:hypothetical protein